MGALKTLLALPLLVPFLLSAGGEASYTMSSWSPWTYSDTGSESWNAMVLGKSGDMWLAGNYIGLKRDVIFMYCTRTNSGAAPGPVWTGYDTGPLDEGPPSIVAGKYSGGGLIYNSVWLAYSRSQAGMTDLAQMWNPVQGIGKSQWLGYSERPYAVAMVPETVNPNTGEPIFVGTWEVNGTEQFILYRWVYNQSGSYAATATFWSGSTADIRGRGVALDSDMSVWGVAEASGDIMLFHYSSSNYQDSGGNWHPKIFPGYPRVHHFSAPADPLTLVRDRLGNLWVAGSLGGKPAVWKFTNAGNLVAGFPRTGPGTGAAYSLCFDDDLNVFGAGYTGTDLLVMGMDMNGDPLVGFPIVRDEVDTVEGRAIAVAEDRSLWIAGTMSGTGAGWTGTVGVVYRYEYSPTPSPAPDGSFVLRAPRGAILDLAQSETMRITAHPVEPGEIRFQVLTMRGELVWESVATTTGKVDVSAVWDGRNRDREPVASGVYAVRVAGAGMDSVKRMAVIRKGK